MTEQNSKELPKSFNQLILNSDKPVLVDFFAVWCKPCKTVSPIIKRIAREYKERLLAIKVNIDAKRHVQAHYHVHSVPTIMLFWKGEELLRITGAKSYTYYKEKINLHLPEE
ncbi:thioredoxin [candidate division WOR-3 bacterium]|nr:thioredoxin [candidate division WOR-3 bacterium]